jgi:hypothetical protein
MMKDEIAICKKALHDMAVDFIDTMIEEASMSWADWDTERGKWIMRPNPTKEDIERFVQDYIEGTKK